MINLRKTKSLRHIVKEWDAIAQLRENQIYTGKDHSANFVLAPAILRELTDVTSLIDIGCGTGWLTDRAKSFSKTTIGIDPSVESIEIAKIHHLSNGISYYSESIESYALKNHRYDVAISNMAASSSPDLNSFISSSRKILNKNAKFIFTIPHPCFWPIYWGYASHPDFKYEETCAVEGEFKIKSEKSLKLTTHFHHPLEQYFELLANNKFIIESVHELLGQGFNLPRFILIKAKAV